MKPEKIMTWYYYCKVIWIVPVYAFAGVGLYIFILPLGGEILAIVISIAVAYIAIFKTADYLMDL